MLSSDIPRSPRPLPPAKARRSVSLQSRLRASSKAFDSRPPPPYIAPDTVFTGPTLLGYPISVTTKLMELAEGQGVSWMQEKSKEELEELLQKAGDIIKERGEELEMTSVACRNLSSSNATLKLRNDALLAGLPEVERESLPSSPSPTSQHMPSEQPPTPSFTPEPPVWIPSVSTLSSKRHRRAASKAHHARRASATPAELAAMADQNAELLTKLQDLEADAASREQAGKRRLKGLEREIQGLKDELDRTHAQSASLEQSLHERGSPAGKKVFEGMPEGLEEDLVKMWKKMRREERAKEMRGRSRPWEESGSSGEVGIGESKDFAPPLPWLSPKRTSRLRKPKSCASMSALHLSLEDEMFQPAPPNKLSSPESDGAQPASHVDPNGTAPGHSAREQALVSQLLAKIRELEETNTELVQERLETSRRLQHAEGETESVKRLCEFISEEVRAAAPGDGMVAALHLEMVSPSSDEGSSAGNDSDGSGDQEDVFGGLANPGAKNDKAGVPKTITLRSVRSRASMNFNLIRKKDDKSFSVVAASSDIGEVRHSSPLGRKTWNGRKAKNVSPVDNAAGPNGKTSRKIRKTVRGLFDEPGTSHCSSSSGSDNKSSDVPSNATRPIDQSNSTSRHTQKPSIATSESLDFFSASGSFDDENMLGHSSSLATSNSTANLPTLSVELSKAFHIDSANGHSSSLRSCKSFSHIRSSSLADLLSSTADEDSMEVPASATNSVFGANFNASPTAETMTTPSSSKSSKTNVPSARLHPHGSMYLSRMDKEGSIRLRTLARSKNSFILRLYSRETSSNGGFATSLPSSPSKSAGPASPTSASIPTGTQAPKDGRNALVGLLVEFWLWLQFGVLLLVVVYSMARRGPKGYLHQTPATPQKARAVR